MKSSEPSIAKEGRVLRRWLDQLFAVVIAIMICGLLQPSFNTVVGSVINQLSLWPFFGQLLLLIFIASAGWFVLIHLGAFRFTRDCYNRNVWLYPATWQFGVIGAAIYSVLFLTFSDAGAAPATKWSSIGIFCAVVLVGVVFAVIFSRVVNHTEPRLRCAESLSIGLEGLSSDPKTLVKWLAVEEPIEDVSDDYLDSSTTAQRLARLLRTEKFGTIGLIGPYGCGKSSLINLILNDLQQPNKTDDFVGVIITCRVRAWGIPGGQAPSIILEQVVDALGQHVDCLSIRQLPGEYRAALSHSGSGILAWIESLLSNPRQPETVLKRVDEILAAIGKRLVIFIEDLDRNPGSDHDIREVAALLDRLKRLRHLSFIFAVGPEIEASNILVRVCEHTETFQPLPDAAGFAILKAFRDQCRSLFGSDIDPLSEADREKNFGFINELARSVLASLHPDRDELPVALLELLNTPRLLKNVLGRVLRTWQHLHGEIDLDDLLVANAIRTSAPEAFAFIYDNYGRLQRLANGRFNRGDENEKKLQALLKEQWAAVSKILLINSSAVETLMDFLFPGALGLSYHNSKPHPQQIRFDSGVNYWTRFNAEEVPAHMLRDQDMIKALQAWNVSPASANIRGTSIPNLIYQSEQNATVMEQWGALYLDPVGVRSLALTVVNIALAEKGATACAENIPSFISLWRLSLEKRMEPSAHREWAKKMLNDTLRVSLLLAGDIFYYWGSQERGDRETLDTNLRDYMINEMKSLLSLSPDALVRLLSPSSPPWALARMMMLTTKGRMPDGGEIDNGKIWAWFAPVLSAALVQKPAIMLPQIATLMTNDPHPFPGETPVFQFQWELLCDTFGDRLCEILEALGEALTHSKTEVLGAARFECLRQAVVQFKESGVPVKEQGAKKDNKDDVELVVR